MTNKDTGHVCECGNSARYAKWMVINDPDIGEKAEMGWVWECIDCKYEREEGIWRDATCDGCGYWASLGIQERGICRNHTWNFEPKEAGIGQVGPKAKACPEYSPKEA